MRHCRQVSTAKPGKPRRSMIGLIAGLSLLACQAHAQTASIRFSTLSLEDGLSQATVTAAVQDPAGFMWFGTQDGLNRYDGYKFVQLKHDPRDPGTLRNDSIFTLYLDPGGDIWVGTEGGGLSRWDTSAESFVHYTEETGAPAGFGRERIRTITRDRGGVLWIGSHESGLYRFDETNGQWSHYLSDPDDGKSLSDNRVRAIYEDRTGRLWIGTRGGLNLLQPPASTLDIVCCKQRRRRSQPRVDRVIALLLPSKPVPAGRSLGVVAALLERPGARA